jgi:hypothetical protein
MTENAPRECPFCDFEPDVAKEDVKTAPEMEVHRVYRHVETEHPERVDQLPQGGDGE